MDFGNILTVICNGMVLLYAVVILIMFFLYTYWSWRDPARLRAVETKRIQHWPFLSARYREQQISLTQTDNWLQWTRLTTTFGMLAFLAFITVLAIQIFASSRP